MREIYSIRSISFVALLLALIFLLPGEEVQAGTAWCPASYAHAVIRPNYGVGLTEISLVSTTTTAWALLFPRRYPVKAGEQLKIVWKMGGNGELNIFARDAAAHRITTSSGPVPHVSSSWHRPGDEWGTEFIIPHGGCWDFHLTRKNVSADLWLTIAAKT
jgi:hypothetical protein